MNDLVEDVARATGHRFTDLALLLSALTHPSYAHEHPHAQHYQRLEFLGDAVVDLCATTLLVDRYPDVPEGDLNDLRQRLVNTKALGEVGREMGLERHVRLGGSEAMKARVEPKILGDVVEAVLGALFQEAGLPACQRVVDQWLAPRAEALRAAHAADLVKNPINRLQEFSQAVLQAQPSYAFRHVGPDHDRVFYATVALCGEVLVEGEGRSKKAATKQAAGLALEILRRRHPASS